MARVNNPTLGTIACSDCGDSADVRRTSRGKARYLYTCCPRCGTDQRTGKAVQTRLWFGTEWRQGLKPVEAPPNVALAVQSEPETVPESISTESNQDDDFDPTQPDVEPVSPVQPAKKKSFVGAVMGFGGLVLLACAALRSA